MYQGNHNTQVNIQRETTEMSFYRASRSQPSTPERTSTGSVGPFIIPSHSPDLNKNVSVAKHNKNHHNLPSPGRSRAITKTNSPPRTNASLHVDTSIFSANQSFEEFSRDSFEDSSTVSSPSSPLRKRNSSFTHIRCLNCQNQYVVSARRSPGKHDSEFCSGECRCSFLAAGIETTYGGHNDQQQKQQGESMAMSFVLSSDDEED